MARQSMTPVLFLLLCSGVASVPTTVNSHAPNEKGSWAVSDSECSSEQPDVSISESLLQVRPSMDRIPYDEGQAIDQESQEPASGPDLKFVNMLQDHVNLSAPVFKDVGAGCCSGKKGQSRAALMRLASFQGNKKDLKACQQQCTKLGAKKCGFIDYGWKGKTGQWCVVHPPKTQCSSTKAGKTDCGGGGGNNGVHAYKFFAKAPAPEKAEESKGSSQSSSCKCKQFKESKECVLRADTSSDEQVLSNCGGTEFPVGQKFCLKGTMYTVSSSYVTSMGADVDHEPKKGRGKITKGTKFAFGSCEQ